MIALAFHLLNELVSKRRTVRETYQETNTNGDIRCGTTRHDQRHMWLRTRLVNDAYRRFFHGKE